MCKRRAQFLRLAARRGAFGPGSRPTRWLWQFAGWVLVVAAFGGCALLDPAQQDPPAPGIARVETLLIDGVPERLLIRGRDPRNPLLLFVHGGPGFPDAPFRQVNSELERHFTVVHWDQRGSGYSYFPDIPPESMTVAQFAKETLYVSRHLCAEFGQPKLYLVGHSWGTIPALLAVQREPGRFYAYVALSQIVDLDESERRLARTCLRYAQTQHLTGKVAEIEALGPPPYLTMEKQERALDLSLSLFPPVAHQATPWSLTLLAVHSRYYSLRALLGITRSYQFSRDLLAPQLHGFDLRRLAPEIDAPIYFFAGQQDSTLGVSIQHEYYRRLTAPRGKHFVLFQNSSHWPHFEEPVKFRQQMEAVRAQTWPNPGQRAKARE